MLIAATLLSYVLGADHGIRSVIAIGVLGIAAFKITLVGLDFMKLRSAPMGLRAAFESYCLDCGPCCPGSTCSSELWRQSFNASNASRRHDV